MSAIIFDLYVYDSPLCSTGATFSKCVNRVVATILAGSLGIFVHWVAIQSGKAEIFVIGCSVFLFGNCPNPKKDMSFFTCKYLNLYYLSFVGLIRGSFRSYLLAICAFIQSQIRLWSYNLYPHI